MNWLRRINKEVFEWIQAITIALLLSILIRMFLFEVILVEGSSMLPTLNEGDRLIVSKIDYRISQPSFGDIVVFRNTVGTRENYIKRVIGIEGERIEIEGGTLWINGQPITEPYINEIGLDNFERTLVPEGTIFVLGDNRNHSRDSRNPHVGFVSIDDIIGRARIRIWPISELNWFN